MKNFNQPGSLSIQMHGKLFAQFLIITNAMGLLMYAFLHVVFYEFPFDTSNELDILAKLFFCCSGFSVSLNLLLLTCDGIQMMGKQFHRWNAWPEMAKLKWALPILLIFLYSCSKPVVTGVKRDFDTGLRCAYSGMETGKAYLVMNQEELHHTDIPFGESFVLVNDEVKGLTVKGGKVKVGCSLTITDERGKIILDQPDLFAGKDEMPREAVHQLKCTVNTGEPMQWEEKYRVEVRFWDKFGTGSIENQVTIRSIGIP